MNYYQDWLVPACCFVQNWYKLDFLAWGVNVDNHHSVTELLETLKKTCQTLGYLKQFDATGLHYIFCFSSLSIPAEFRPNRECTCHNGDNNICDSNRPGTSPGLLES